MTGIISRMVCRRGPGRKGLSRMRGAVRVQQSSRRQVALRAARATPAPRPSRERTVEEPKSEKRKQTARETTGNFGLRPLMEPSTSVKPPHQGPQGAAGDSGASQD